MKESITSEGLTLEVSLPMENLGKSLL